ncbi:MAG: hypothetical protein ACR2MA_10770 [Egibacteraceae bacterium]
MTGEDDSQELPSRGDASTTAAGGTPVPVPVSVDRRARESIILVLSGPVIWTAHFLLVYAVAEAGCTGSGAGLRLFDPPVPSVFTLVATGVASVACLGSAWWGYRRWRAAAHAPSEEQTGARSAEPQDESEETSTSRALSFVGFLLGLLSFVTVLFVGLPAVVLGC